MKLRILLLVHETIVVIMSLVKNRLNTDSGVGVCFAFG